MRPERAGPERAGPERAGPERAGPSRTKPEERTEPDRAGPSAANERGLSQARPSQRDQPLLRELGWWTAWAFAAISLWGAVQAPARPSHPLPPPPPAA